MKDLYKIKNVNFSIVDKKDKCWNKFKNQRKKRGFDDSELWNLDHTISKFILPRLKRFKNITMGYPACITEKEWDDTLDTMINAFEYIVKEETDTHQNEIKKGLDNFRKYFFNLWF